MFVVEEEGAIMEVEVEAVVMEAAVVREEVIMEVEDKVRD